MDRYLVLVLVLVLVLDLPGRSSDRVCDNVESSSQARAKQEFLPRMALPSSSRGEALWGEPR